MIDMANSQHYSTLFGKHADSPATIKEWQIHSLKQFLCQGFPDQRQEAWKYTPIKFLERLNFTPTTPTTTPDFSNELIPSPSYLAVFINGLFYPVYSQLALQPDIVCIPLSQAITQYPEDIATYLQQSTTPSSFAHFNAAFLQDGLFLKLKEGAILDKPLHLLFLSQSPEPETMQHLRNMIICEKNSRATVIEHYHSYSSPRSLTNTLTQLYLQDHSHLTHLLLQEEHEQCYHFGEIDATLGAHSVLKSHFLDLGSQLTRREFQISLEHPFSHVELNGLYSAREKQHIDNHTYIHHRYPNTSSSQTIKGIIGERARAVFNGNITVYPDAQKTDAQLHNHNLMLSDQAEIDTKPELEIYADDVKCAHGATVGQLDEEALFYLKTRGLSAEQAHSLLICGFALEVIQTVEDDALSHFLKQRFLNTLKHENMDGEWLC